VRTGIGNGKLCIKLGHGLLVYIYNNKLNFEIRFYKHVRFDNLGAMTINYGIPGRDTVKFGIVCLLMSRNRCF
jgi:hypothetical protein